MTVRMGLISKKADWTWEDFNAYWRDEHGALARRVDVRGHFVDQLAGLLRVV